MNKRAQLNRIKRIVVPLLKKHGVARAGIFGSYARGEQKKKSDIDILIQPSKHMGFAFFGLAMELQKILKKSWRKLELKQYQKEKNACINKFYP